ncbi:YbjQ family protein [uncultured Desulfosarcina sp.]|uniref:YbjQ family protein n=1 Tax=uncultured Desulfosarcina sp. TaxID=218289 RepID=UPI0029C65C31|nr:YbjQ family protein [uncultured Desulfosarcina sp.]
MSDRYTVIFEGRVMPGKNVDMVKERLKSALKTDDQGLARLFTGSPVAVRKSTDKATAEKYTKVFAAAGAFCEIRKDEPSGAPQAPPRADDPAPQAGPPATPEPADPPPAPPASQVKTHYITTSDGGKMVITNIETVPGKTVTEHFGLVSGSTIRAKHIGRDFMAGLKNLVGGELKGYTQLLQESRQQAMDRMIEEARLLGANAIVNVRFSTSSVAQGAAELYAYGTAVKVQ